MKKHNTGPIRHGCLLAKPSRLIKEGRRTTVFTDRLDPHKKELDDIDLYNALISTRIAAKSLSDLNTTQYRTAIPYDAHLTLFVEYTGKELWRFLDSITQTRNEPLLSPLAALLFARPNLRGTTKHGGAKATLSATCQPLMSQTSQR